MKFFIVMVTIVTSSIIATLAAPSEGADLRLNVNYKNEIPNANGRCPPNLTDNFDVIFHGENSSAAKGCASFEFRAHPDFSVAKELNVRFGRWKDSEPRVCVLGDYEGIEQLLISCLPTSDPLPVNSKSVNMYLLYGQVKPVAGKLDTRCVLYNVVNSAMNILAVSSTTTCSGLSRIMFDSKAKFPKGSMLLQLNQSSNNLRQRRSTLDDKNSTQLNFSGSRFFWRAG